MQEGDLKKCEYVHPKRQYDTRVNVARAGYKVGCGWGCGVERSNVDDA